MSTGWRLFRRRSRVSPFIFRPAAAMASTSGSISQVDEGLINDDKLWQEGRNRRNQPPVSLITIIITQ